LQSEDDLKAMGNIKYAYTNQPQWMKQMHPLASGEEGTSHKVEWATGSLIRALPSGIRKFAWRTYAICYRPLRVRTDSGTFKIVDRIAFPFSQFRPHAFSAFRAAILA
jgi:hypothetical protein